MRRETQNVVLVLLGGALVKIALNGDYLRYVKASQQPLVLAGGGVLAALGTVAILRDLRARAGASDEHHHDARPAWLMLVPVFAMLLVAPPALGADAVERTGPGRQAAMSQRGSSAFPPLPPGPVVGLPVSEFVARAGWSAAQSLRQHTVALSGFVVHDAGTTMLARMVISCCAADAYPVTVRLRGGAAARLPEDSWIEVTGTAVPPVTTADRRRPVLEVATLRTIPAPADPYET